ncbi:MAG: Lipoprotein releasing system ATP-binding protein LolD [Myxococcaceae bacterium]|nr:Lipoprotein releasing system ATP-binding protein LolD [Myxococcaceae bacterium]
MIIQLKDVVRSYGQGAGKVHALRGITADIEAGSMTAIVGPSGSGKSTLLNLLGALDQPSSGQVIVAGHDLGKLNDNALTKLRRERIGFVFQFFNHLPTLSAKENVLLPAKLAGRAGKELTARAEELLIRVGLKERMHHRPDQLSGGEMQRVAISRALIMDPPVLLADEPTGNLDSKTGREVMTLLRGAVDARRTVILVTHDPRMALIADRVLTIRDGELAGNEKVEPRSADELFDSKPPPVASTRV